LQPAPDGSNPLCFARPLSLITHSRPPRAVRPCAVRCAPTQPTTPPPAPWPNPAPPPAPDHDDAPTHSHIPPSPRDPCRSSWPPPCPSAAATRPPPRCRGGAERGGRPGDLSASAPVHTPCSRSPEH